MNIATAEKLIIEKLQKSAADFAVDAYPDKPQHYNLSHPNGAYLVRYSGSRYNTTDAIEGLVMQNRVMQFEVVSVTRGLRNNSGAYKMVEKALATLTGFQIENNDGLYPIEDGFRSELDGLWQYGITFGLDVLHEEC